MNAAERLEKALEQIGDVADRIEQETKTYIGLKCDWEIQTADSFDRHKSQKKSDAWTERLVIREHPDLYRELKDAEAAFRASCKVSEVLENAIRGYQTQNKNERIATGMDR